MTVQYDGIGFYRLMFSNVDYVLSEEMINEIQNFNFKTMKSDNYIEGLEKNFDNLQEFVEDTEWEIGKVIDEINDGKIKSVYEIATKLGKLLKIH